MLRVYLCILMISLICFPPVGMAVIVAGGDGTQNTTAPSGGQGWDYVGRITSVNGAPSGVTYISNNWFITANHIKVQDNPTGVILGGVTYSIDPNSWTRLQNSEGGDADLIMCRVVGGTVGLSGLTVRTSATSNGSGLTMIGNGRNRESSETHWNVDTQTDPLTWTEVSTPPPSDLSGYKWAVTGSTKRWGTNTKEADAGLVTTSGGRTDLFYTDFDSNTGQAQGATYDSGGGVFYKNGGNWELAGIMIATGGYTDQPAGTSVYGNRTYMADIRYYAAQINSIALIEDIDGDGIPDGWEYEKTGSTIGVVAGIDQDGDGFTGAEEWIADTVPVDSNSYLRVSAYANVAEVVFDSSTNRQYQVDYRTDLADSNETWQAEVLWFTPTSSPTVMPVTTSTSNRYYRVEVKL